VSEEALPPLVPVEERRVDFYGDTIVAALVEVDNQPEVYIPLRPLCEYLGLRWSGQYERLQRDPVLAEALQFVRVSTTNPRGGDPEVLALPLEYLPGWLFGISTSRVKPELQDKITRYRRECFRVLWRAFQADALRTVGAPDAGAVRVGHGSSLAQIREMGLAIAQMAEQQIALEQRVTTHDARIDRAATVIKELQRRIGVVEERVEPAATIGEREAAVVSSAVKALAEYLTGTEAGKNHYQGIFAELYRRFGVSSYKLIRQGDYAAVLQFLEDWRGSVEAKSAKRKAENIND
jgi:hypothetical protein